MNVEDKYRPHPAKYTAIILDNIIAIIAMEQMYWEETGRFGNYMNILDPFGGVGTVHTIQTVLGSAAYRSSPWCKLTTTAVEIEEEWAVESSGKGHTVHADVLDWEPEGKFDVICTSPCYGNRMADHHEAKEDSVRNTYRHKLGRPLTEGSAAGMQWGDAYKNFHLVAWKKVYRLLQWDGLFILNVKDHIRKGEVMPVVAWHHEVITGIFGNTPIYSMKVPVKGNRQGENHELRVDHEMIYVWRKA